MIIPLNTNTLNPKEVDVRKTKVRAFLTINGKILVAHYGDIILLPGGSVEKEELPYDAIIRELKEETGAVYEKKELSPRITIVHYQPDYITRNNEKESREIITIIYEGKFKGIDLESINLTQNEKEDNFYLELISKERLEELITQETTNHRKPFFDEEMKAVTKVLKPRA